MQYVLLSYMKYLGVKVKEPRGLEPKRTRINFLPKIKVWNRFWVSVRLPDGHVFSHASVLC